MPPILPVVQAVPERSPMFDSRGELVAVWRRFFQTVQAAVNTLLQGGPQADPRGVALAFLADPLENEWPLLRPGVVPPVLPAVIVVASGRIVGATGAVTIVTYKVGAADASFEISANLQLTLAGTLSFNVVVTYTDEIGTANTVGLTFSPTGAGPTLFATFSSSSGLGAYEGVPLHFRCQANSTITVKTLGSGPFGGF